MEQKAKKQLPLRISEQLYVELERWAEDDFRSVNGQIEYLLSECVRYRKKGKSAVGLSEKDDQRVTQAVAMQTEDMDR